MPHPVKKSAAKLNAINATKFLFIVVPFKVDFDGALPSVYLSLNVRVVSVIDLIPTDHECEVQHGMAQKARPRPSIRDE